MFSKKKPIIALNYHSYIQLDITVTVPQIQYDDQVLQHTMLVLSSWLPADKNITRCRQNVMLFEIISKIHQAVFLRIFFGETYVLNPKVF